jgi:hypothetical protein
VGHKCGIIFCSFVSSLFNDTVRNSEYIESNDFLIMNELERMWKETVVDYFKVLYMYLLRWIEGKYEKSQM